MADLSELLERLRAATGPDRDLDRSICLLLAKDMAVPDGPMGWMKSPEFTASIDAALALVERALPGTGVSLWAWPDRATATIGTKAIDFAEYMTPLGSGEAPTSPLAILLAALTAIQSIGDET